MGLTAVIDSGTFQVRQACEVVIALTSTHELAPGDTVEVQFPNTWSLIAVQQPLEWPAMAWTSPVWVDLPDGR